MTVKLSHDITVEEFLAHYGVLGMHWGTRKSEPSSNSRNFTYGPKAQSQTTEDKANHDLLKSRAKKVAIGVGILAVVVGAGVVAYQLKKSGKLPLSSIKGAVAEDGKKAAEAIVKEPTDIVHVSRGKNVGFSIIRTGGSPAPLREYETAFGVDQGGSEMFKRYGKSSEKIAARILDPKGRLDFAGRPISHEIIVPSTMTEDVKSLDDVKSKIWPLLKDAYETVYNQARS